MGEERKEERGRVGEEVQSKAKRCLTLFIFSCFGGSENSAISLLLRRRTFQWSPNSWSVESVKRLVSAIPNKSVAANLLLVHADVVSLLL